MVDSLSKGLEAMLSHVYEHYEHSLAVRLRTFSKAEASYSQLDREALVADFIINFTRICIAEGI